MAITEVGTRSIADISVADGAQTVNNVTHTTTANTDLLLAFIGMEGNEGLVASGCQFGGVDLTEIHDTGSTGSNGDIRIYVYGIVSPGESSSTARTSIQGSGTPLISVWVNINGTATSSVAAATNFISESNNTTPASTNVLSSGGSSPNGLMAWGVAQNSNMANSAFDSGFTELLEGETDVSADDISYNLASHFAGAPSGTTITWASSNECAAVLIELGTSTGGIVQHAMHHYRNHGKLF